MMKVKLYRDGPIARAGAAVRSFFGLSTVKHENILINDLNAAENQIVEARKKATSATAAYDSLRIEYASVAVCMSMKLNAIVPLETPKANSASRKMAAIARDALKQLESAASK